MPVAPRILDRRLASPREDVHAEGLAVAGHNGADLAVTVDAERLPAKAAADRIRLPFPGPERGHFLGDPAHRGDHEPPRQLGGGVGGPPRTGLRGQDHAAPGAGLDLDMGIDAHLADDAEAVEALQQRRADRCALADELQRLRVLEPLRQLVDVRGVVVPDRHLVARRLAEAPERADRVLVIVEDRDVHGCPRSLRTSAAPAPRARSLPRATSRSSGTIPQLVQGRSRSGGTCFMASRITAATSSAVSTRSVATSMAPTSTSLSPSMAMSERGTREFAHSRDTPPTRLFELEHVHAERLELARLLVDEPGQLHSEARAALVMLVVDRVHDGHGTRDGELERPPCLRPGESDLGRVDGATPADGRRHRRRVRLVAIGSDANGEIGR